MAYNGEDVRKVKEILAGRRSEALETSYRRKLEAAAKIPGYAEIEEALSATGSKIMDAAFTHSLDDVKLNEIRAENEGLRSRKARLLTQHGYEADYTDIHYFCKACSDTGYIGVNMCTCMREELIKAGIESAGLNSLVKTQSFETFSLDFYENHDRIVMESNARQLWRFANGFSAETTDSWLLTGATGLGKTHLSTAVAGVVIRRGFNVIYDTVQDILEVYEEDRFQHGEGVQHQRGRTVEAIQTCDLLIVDDLGSELTNQFTVSCLYNMINTRITRGKPTIINTNLNQAEIRSRYSDRISSRLFGEYKPLLFRGSDIRSQKILKK